MRILLLLLVAIVLVALYASDVEAKKPVKKAKAAGEASAPEKNENAGKDSTLASSKEASAGAIDDIAGMLPYTWLTDKNFTKYIGERPRYYHAVLMFTATGEKYKCAICVAAKTSFVDGATLYSEQYNFAAGADSDLSAAAQTTAETEESLMQEASKRVAFFILEVDNARGTFTNMGLETVPRVYALPPTRSASPKLRMSDYEITVQSMLGGTQEFLGEVQRITGVRVAITSNPWQMLLLVGVVGYLLALLAAVAARTPAEALFWYRSPALWWCVSTLCFCVGVSGSIFCIIRSAPLYGIPYGGRSLEIFASQGQQQYVLEGLVVAGLTVTCGLALALVVGAPKLPVGSFVRHMLVLAGMAVVAVCLLELAEAYMFKTPWYTAKETLPKELWAGITSGVKRSSSLPKRLLRLSEIWMFEFKDWASFGKKAQSLMGDWVSQFLGVSVSAGSAAA